MIKVLEIIGIIIGIISFICTFFLIISLQMADDSDE
jgi:hypothetical protein